jgi:hypothetical protein
LTVELTQHAIDWKDTQNEQIVRARAVDNEQYDELKHGAEMTYGHPVYWGHYNLVEDVLAKKATALPGAGAGARP